MTISSLPLSYCTNVHPGRSVAEVNSGLADYTSAMCQKFGEPLAAGLWLARPVVQELLASRKNLTDFIEHLQSFGLTCHTLNAFPYGDFHSERVKENVYIPDWSEPSRFDYTMECAQVLAALLPDETEGSISTVPLGFKEFDHPADFMEQSFDQLIVLADNLDRLYLETGKRIRLAIEPEPFCLLETTPETITFFDGLRSRTTDEKTREVVEQYLGVCYDVCHQAVEFEEISDSISALQQASIRINKVHITCAIELVNPSENIEGREALARYVEPRYLHQTMARTSAGEILRAVDLSQELATDPSPDFRDAEIWRIHFHVPVDADDLGPLGTTRQELKEALAAVKKLDYAPQLEVETYTWEVLPEADQNVDLVAGLTRELSATRELLDELSTNSDIS